MITNEQAAELAHITLEVIAVAHPAALPLHAIRRRIRDALAIDFNYEERDLDSALTFLKGLKLLDERFDGFGASKFWTATSEGVLAQRRGTFHGNHHGH